MAEQTSKFECSCAQCQTACKNHPGWFLPGEADALADKMGISLKELFDTHLAVDWWVGDPDPDGDLDEVFVLSPSRKGSRPGEEVSGNPRGTCTFFKDGLCEVHRHGKPYECVMLTHDSHASHREVAMAWRKKRHQKQIRDLLGRKPYAAEYSLFDLLLDI